MSAPLLALEAFGVRFGIAIAPEPLCDRLAEVLPPGTASAGPGRIERTFSVSEERGRLRLTSEGTLLAETDGLEHLLEVLESELALHVALAAPGRIFVHAGVVALRGAAIVIPGPSRSGKTSLVAALVRAGATYYSDEFAVLDAAGCISPYARDLRLRLPDGSRRRVSVAELGGVAGGEPIPVGLVVVAQHRVGARWRPVPLSAGQAALSLLENTPSARSRPAECLAVLSAATRRARAYRSVRGEAEPAARAVLDLLEPPLP